MPTGDRREETLPPKTIHERCLPTFLVRRAADGTCAPECDFNQGRCLVGWRHPGGSVPWDPRCKDGDVYSFVRVAEGRGWAGAVVNN